MNDNPDEAHSVIYDAAERAVARLVREQAAIERRMASGYRGGAALEALESEVPF